jgi:hypothetical protein
VQGTTSHKTETMRNKNAQQVNKQFLDMEMMGTVVKKFYLHRCRKSPEIITETQVLCNDSDMGTITVASELY